MVDSMNKDDLDQAITLLKRNFIHPAAINETELDRAALQGLLSRLGPGVALLPDRDAASGGKPTPLYREILGGHIGYLRLGSLTNANLQDMETALKDFATKKTDALIIDLRATPQTNDFAITAEFAKRFASKGKVLFSLRKAGAKEEQSFSVDRDPLYYGLIIVLLDEETAGGGEALAGVLKIQRKAMIIGQTTAGRAVEYSDLPLPSGKILRVAVGELILPELKPVFPHGLSPDLPVAMPLAEKREVFQQSLERGMAEYVFERENPHFNEAALIAGRNPEIDAAANAQRRGGIPEKPALRDPVLQRAVDLVTSLAIYEKR